MKTMEVKCPCCKATLTLSRESGKILKYEEFKKGPADFSDFVQKQKSRHEDLAKKFSESKERSRQRLRDIHEKIDFAKKRLEEEEE
jgi:Zn-finger nucleic acid-binding protein